MKRFPHKLRKVVRIFLFTILGLVAAVALLLCGITLWLTPEHLTRLVNEEASKELNADVEAHNVRFTFWSTFPHLKVEMDSLRIRSRNLDSIPRPLRDSLPKNADFLLYAGRLSGGINMMQLVRKRIVLHDVDLDSIRINLVAATADINNYDIIRDTSTGAVPYFTANSIRLRRKGGVTIFSRPSQSDVAVTIDSLGVERFGKSDRYNLRITGTAGLTSDGVRVLQNFPFTLSGNVDLGFNPFRASAEGYSVSLGSVKGKMDIDVNLENDLRINNFNYKLDNFDIADFLPFLPSLRLPLLSRLDIGMEIGATARLLSPYSPSSPWLPSLEVEAEATDGRISYRLQNGRTISANGVRFDGIFRYDGRNPSASYISVPEAGLNIRGLVLEARLKVTDIFTAPMVSAEVEGKTELADIAAEIPEMKGYSFDGECDFTASTRFRFDDIADGRLSRIALKGDVRIPKANFAYVHNNISLRAGGLSLDSRLERGTVKARMKAASVSLASPEGNLSASGVTASAAIPIPTDLSDGIPPFVKGMLTAAALKYSADEEEVSARGIALSFDSRQRSALYTADRAVTIPETWTADSANLARISHTPVFLVADSAMRDMAAILRKRNVAAKLKIKSGRLSMPQYPAPVSFAALDIATDTDSLSLKAGRIATEGTALSLATKVAGLRRWMLADKPVTLGITARIEGDTARLNTIARTYETGLRKAIGDEEMKARLANDFSPLDTMAWLIPRNISLDCSVAVAETHYINLSFSHLKLNASTRDGRLRIDPIALGSPFGEFDFAIDYDSSHLENLGISLAGGVDELDIVPFFNNFHQLLVKMPEMKNLEGEISAQLAASARIFPDMYISVPSAQASVGIHGRGLTLHQNKFIRHVTRMLMIPENGDIHIANVDLRAEVRNNLLMVMPFTFSFSDYSLRLLGVNNFNGDLAYHVGLFRSPLHIPFAVNIEGTYSKPEIKFGGKRWKDKRAAEVVSMMQADDRVNLLVEASHYMKSLVHVAATYYQGKYGNLPLKKN